MATVINITNKLNNEPKFIVLGEGKQYAVNNSYKVITQVQALFADEKTDNSEAMMKAIEMILGKKAKAEIEEMPIENVITVFTAVMAAVQNEPYEVIEARFQENGKTEA